MWFNIGAYGGSDFGARNKQALDKKMNSAKRTRLQELSNNCLASGYQGLLKNNHLHRDV